MNKALQVLLAVAAMMASINAQAQLKSADHGAAVTDSNGLMWANTVGTFLSWSPTSGPGSAQAWIAGLNASDYGGFNDWTLATGDGSVAANKTTNQLGELFYTDCGNSVGTASVLNKAGKNCTALSALNSVIEYSQHIFSQPQRTRLSMVHSTVFSGPTKPQAVSKCPGPMTPCSAAAAYRSWVSVMPWQFGRHPRSTLLLQRAVSRYYSVAWRFCVDVGRRGPRRRNSLIYGGRYRD